MIRLTQQPRTVTMLWTAHCIIALLFNRCHPTCFRATELSSTYLSVSIPSNTFAPSALVATELSPDASNQHSRKLQEPSTLRFQGKHTNAFHRSQKYAARWVASRSPVTSLKPAALPNTIA